MENFTAAGIGEYIRNGIHRIANAVITETNRQTRHVDQPIKASSAERDEFLGADVSACHSGGSYHYDPAFVQEKCYYSISGKNP
jgi:hypothetical protein